MDDDVPLQLSKVASGVAGLDEITNGGFPAGRPTLVCGNPGCGKTLMGLQFLVAGATEHGEPGVFISFEESRDDLVTNVASLGYDLPALIAGSRLRIDHVDLIGNPVEQSGEYDLEGLFIRLGAAIDAVGARRVVIDTLEMLMGRLPDPDRLRSELHRLFRWLKDRGVTAIVTAEAGERSLTRSGLQEYVSDCVIALDHRVNHEISARRLRVVKYRGSTHGTNEFPFLISENGISILPVTSLGLEYGASSERIPTGIEGLDRMLGGKGYYRGSSILVSGTSGTGKSSFAGHLADASARRGEKILYFAYEESAAQILRNMSSIGIDLAQWRDKDLLRIHSIRPTAIGLEAHLLAMLKHIREYEPQLVIVDPLNSFVSGGDSYSIKVMMSRLLDHLKTNGITALSNSLTAGEGNEEHTEIGISSLMDSWLLLRNVEAGEARNHTLTIVKSRGMAHSNRVQAYRFTDHGIVIDPGSETSPAEPAS
jgi:circadian clock protein KaiC